jgi:ribosomal protein S18 acetylase RimI-like enzyme
MAESLQGIEFAELGPGDLPRLLAVEPDLFDEPIRPDQAALFLADPMNLCLLAHDGPLAVGMLTGTILRHPDKAPALFINEVGTRDAWQRRGIATALMQRALDWARRRGCEGVWLGTEADNLPAQALYRSLGADEVAGAFYGWDGALDED